MDKNTSNKLSGSATYRLIIRDATCPGIWAYCYSSAPSGRQDPNYQNRATSAANKLSCYFDKLYNPAIFTSKSHVVT